MEVTITFFSDTHTYHKNVILPPSDIAIFCGDFSDRGSKSNTEQFLRWYASQDQCTKKVMIAGNHDLCLDPKFDDETGADNWIDPLMKKYENDVIYLQARQIKLFGLKIWGCAVTPDFFPQHWAFNMPRGEKIAGIWELIPSSADIIVTHGPVYGKLDLCMDGNVGCNDLKEVVERIQPKVFACGHIHEGYGQDEENGITYINASICNGSYRPVNLPITVTLNV
jgi:Icc-related predicted phosphoesterase